MKASNSVLARANNGFRPMEKALPLRFFLLAAAVMLTGCFLVEKFLFAGLGLAVLGMVLLAMVSLISMKRMDAHETEYLNGLEQDALLALIGKDMRYQSKISTSKALNTLDRRFPNWRDTAAA